MGKFWARISNSVFKWLPWGIKALAFPRVSHMKYFNLLLTSRLGAWRDWALSAAPLEWGLLTCTWKNSTFESQHYLNAQLVRGSRELLCPVLTGNSSASRSVWPWLYHFVPSICAAAAHPSNDRILDKSLKPALQPSTAQRCWLT